MTRNIKKRSSLFVKKDFQKRFIFKIILVLFIITIIPILLYLLFTLFTNWGGNKFSEMIILYTYQLLRTRFLVLTGSLLFLFFVLALILSKQIAGPVFRIENELDRLVDGDFSRPVKLRENDEFQEIADKLNELSNNFKVLINQSRDLVNNLDSIDNKQFDINTEVCIKNLKKTIQNYSTEETKIEGK